MHDAAHAMGAASLESQHTGDGLMRSSKGSSSPSGAPLPPRHQIILLGVCWDRISGFMELVHTVQGYGLKVTVRVQREAAAVIVQAAWRAFTVRADLRCQQMAATFIQVRYSAYGPTRRCVLITPSQALHTCHGPHGDVYVCQRCP